LFCTYNPQPSRSSAKTLESPMFKTLKHRLVILDWRHDSTSLRGPLCRQL
jgi:hypothetical protein